MPTPTWSAARSGLLGDPGAVDASAQINQLLGTHGITLIRQGAQILTPNGSGGTDWTYHLDTYDVAQPFTMSGTTIGRVVLPLLASGTGGDLIVSLYTNNAGTPGTLVTQVRVPASWLTQQSALTGAAGTSSTAPAVQDTSNALATATNYTFHVSAWTQSNAWTYPAVGATSRLFPNSFASLSGNYFISVGGTNSSNAAIANVFTYFYAGGTTLDLGVAQPSLPQSLFSAAVAATSNTVICMGGVNSIDQSTVYTASWNGAGTVGAWSQQTSLPQAIESTTSGAAVWNDSYVYLVGGSSSGTSLNTVYWAQVQNGQITGWNSGPPLPIQVTFTNVAVIGNYLVVTGGTPPSGPAVVSTTYFAPISANGSLGAWRIGPTSPVPTSGGIVANSSGLFIIGGWTTPSFSPTNDLQSLSFDTNGPGTWFRQTYNGTLPTPSNAMSAIFPSGTDTWQVFNLAPNSYLTAKLTRTPTISIPLPATGLSNGTTYHIVLSQPGADHNNYLWLSDDLNVFPGNPTALTRATGSTSWAATALGHAVPLAIFDASTAGPVLHLWEDAGTRITTIASTAADPTVIGLLEAVEQPGPILNMNPTFTSGVAPWTGNNGTLAQSNTFTHGNLPFSAKLTPNGTSSQAYIESELVAIDQTLSYTASPWFYSPAGYASCVVQINWYTALGFSGGFISSTAGSTTSVAAGAWTQLPVGSTQPPASAVYGTIGVYESGTPSSSAVFYASAAALQSAPSPQLSSVAQVDYAPGVAGMVRSPVGVTVLA